MKLRYKLLPWGCFLFATILLLCGLVPLMLHVFNIGSLFLCLGAFVFLGAGLWARQLSQNGRQAKGILFLLSLTLFALTASGIVWNSSAHQRPPSPNGKAIVVVLGCKVNADKPSLMLRRRLDVALSYLNSNPEALCIVSGGQGKGETQTEASVMQEYLTQKGISPARIFAEDQSTNTETNLKNSITIAQEKKLDGEWITCSDGFHQLRAALYAKRFGKQTRALSSKTPPLVLPSYFVRELLAVLKMAVTTI